MKKHIILIAILLITISAACKAQRSTAGAQALSAQQPIPLDKSKGEHSTVFWVKEDKPIVKPERVLREKPKQDSQPSVTPANDNKERLKVTEKPKEDRTE